MPVFRFSAFVAALLLLAACGKRGNWPEGMEPIHWDRDTCASCGMAISDPRFAVELLRGKSGKSALKFDDIGCLVAWTNGTNKKAGLHPWREDAKARVWVADFNSPINNREALRWLDARTARYIERSSPMGYNFAAVENSDEKTVDFDEIMHHGQAHQHGGGQGVGQ
ncbi:MAG: nitrous oxide reductase accessory protein NosL [Betaproteobacteria bacterium]|nr:nitrous oxide reductase accessory protein NosL [Betaproteobacteria bacterium]